MTSNSLDLESKLTNNNYPGSTHSTQELFEYSEHITPINPSNLNMF